LGGMVVIGLLLFDDLIRYQKKR